MAHSPKSDDFIARLTQAMPAAGQTTGPRPPAPVHLWSPDYCGEMDLVIKTDGSWWHEGRPITRPALVDLFASVLKREGDRYFLITPVEKLAITVEDAPFFAPDADNDEQGITVTTTLGHQVRIGPDHPLILRGTPDNPRPYVVIYNDLEALLDRKAFYRLAEQAEAGPDGRFGIQSGGAFFALDPQ